MHVHYGLQFILFSWMLWILISPGTSPHPYSSLATFHKALCVVFLVIWTLDSDPPPIFKTTFSVGIGPCTLCPPPLTFCFACNAAFRFFLANTALFAYANRSWSSDSVDVLNRSIGSSIHARKRGNGRIVMMERNRESWGKVVGWLLGEDRAKSVGSVRVR